MSDIFDEVEKENDAYGIQYKKVQKLEGDNQIIVDDVLYQKIGKIKAPQIQLSVETFGAYGGIFSAVVACYFLWRFRKR